MQRRRIRDSSDENGATIGIGGQRRLSMKAAKDAGGQHD
jgi:hypothetical protein